MRGLKPRPGMDSHRQNQSHLLQMRGLKLQHIGHTYHKQESHLLQMRGLKPLLKGLKSNYKCRIFYRCVDWNLPTIGARHPFICRIFYRCVDWNYHRGRTMEMYNVASFTDAWIETCTKSLSFTFTLSHLLQMRGLKPKERFVQHENICRIFYRCVDWNIFFRF